MKLINVCRQKFKQVTAEKLKYEELVTLCKSNNALNTKLIEARNQNQIENEIYYNNEIIKNDSKINNITISLNNEVIDSSTAQVADQQNLIKVVSEILVVSESSITVDGNLNISTTQKLKLSIKLRQNIHQITTIQRKLASLNYADLGRLRLTQKKLNDELRKTKKKGPNKNLGDTLLTIGGAIIGTALIAKGFLDPETAGGLMLGATGAVGGIKGGQGWRRRRRYFLWVSGFWSPKLCSWFCGMSSYQPLYWVLCPRIRKDGDCSHA